MPGPNCAGADDSPKNLEPLPLDTSPAQERARLMLQGPARYCCLAGGTRSGKTFLIVREIVARAAKAPNSRHAILRLHANAARTSIARDTLPTVFTRCFPQLKPKEHKVEGYFSLENGARISVGGLDDDDRVEKILGLEYATVFLNEASQISYRSALFAMTRLAQKTPELEQRCFVDLNPTSNAHWTNVLFGEKRNPQTHEPLEKPELYDRAFLNPLDNAANLEPAYLEMLAGLPERERQRFYEGVYVEESDAALWTLELLNRFRRDHGEVPLESLKTIVVGVDPAGGGADETGIVVAALGNDNHIYVLHDLSLRSRPEVWAERVVKAYREHRARLVVAETNYGGEMVPAMITTVDENVTVKSVFASRSKAARAAPVSARYAQGKVHHVGRHLALEQQLCDFSMSGYGGDGSPDRADAAIWAITALFTVAREPGISEFYARALETP